MKDEELHGLLKVPDEAIIKELRIELGKQSSYIQELEDEIKLLKSLNNDDVEEKRKIRREQIFYECRQRIRGLEQTIFRLRKDNEYLIVKLNNK